MNLSHELISNQVAFPSKPKLTFDKDNIILSNDIVVPLSKLQLNGDKGINTPDLSPDLNHPLDIDDDKELTTPTESNCNSPKFNGRGMPSLGDKPYIAIKELGHGSFAKVYYGKDIRDNKEVAIKLMEYNDENLRFFNNERDCLKRLSHKNLVNYIDSFIINGYCALIMEYCNYGDLFSYIEVGIPKSTPNIQMELFKQCVEAVNYVHSKHIAHRDIKLENFLLHKETPTSFPIIKLADFGLAVPTIEPMSAQRCGSLEYMAPEVLLSSQRVCPIQVDVWSLGVVLYGIVYRELPFSVREYGERTTMKKIALADFKLIEKEGVDHRAKDWIKSMIKLNPRHRVKLKEWLDLNC